MGVWEDTVSYQCLVCAYAQMPLPPNDYNICPCCGIEYGLDDAFESYEDLRDEWLLAGGPWFSDADPYLQPANWNPWSQLEAAQFPYNVPRPDSHIKTDISFPSAEGFRLIAALRQRPEWAEA